MVSEEAVNKSMEETLTNDDTGFPTYEMTHRGGAVSKRGTLGRSTLGRRSAAGATAMIATKSPPRPAPSSVNYSDDDTVKGYDDNSDSSDITEKPTDISSTDSQESGSDCDDDPTPSTVGVGLSASVTAVGAVAPGPSGPPPTMHQSLGARGGGTETHSFVNHYANVNETLRQSWRRQKPIPRNYSSYTDSEAEGSAVMSLNGGQIVMNNMAGSRAPLPGFSSFV